MAITYEKKIITKDRRIMPSGPRDRQRKQKMQQAPVADSSALITELREHISSLQRRLSEAPKGGYTAEQVDEEIIKAIKVETADLKAKYVVETSKVESLKKEIESIEKSHKKELAAKDEIIAQLKSAPAGDNNVTALLAEATKKIEDMATQLSFKQTGEMPESDRPKIEPIFIDPIEKETKVESHFEVEDISIAEKDQMVDKVSKLKNLMGGLPLKRG